MSGVAGSEVLYRQENKNGSTTLTFRKRRYLFPTTQDTSVRGQHGGRRQGRGTGPLSASTGDIQHGHYRGPCVMADVGMFCPYCSGAIKTNSLLRDQLTGARERRDGTDAGSGPAPQGAATVGSESPLAKIKRTKEGAAIYEVSPPIHECECNKRDMSRTVTASLPVLESDVCTKLSSSDYSSMDRDSCFSSSAASADTCISADGMNRSFSPNTSGSYYSSSLDRQRSNSTDIKAPPLDTSMSHRYYSLPRDVPRSRTAYNTHLKSEEGRLIDSMQVDFSVLSEEALVEELLSDELLEEEYQNLVNASLAKSQQEHSMQPTASQKPHSDILDKSQDGHVSDRSTSPEVAVDDALENMDSEIFAGDVTLPRVFALTRSGNSLKKAQKSRKVQCQREEILVQIRSSPSPKVVTRTVQTSKVHYDSVPRKASSDQSLVFSKKDKHQTSAPTLFPLQRTDYSHEDFFEEVVEALTDLDEGSTTDWTSDYDSDSKETTSRESKTAEASTPDDSINVLSGYDLVVNKTATSSCECIADDASRDMDSSLEHIPSSYLGTPSETSGGGYSTGGYGSSSEGSLGDEHHTKIDSELLFEQIIQNTQSLTEELSHILENELDTEIDFGKDQLDSTDEVFLEKCKPSDFQQHRTTPQELENATHTIRSAEDDVFLEQEDSYMVEEDVGSSLENLLTYNADHCSTSDLDEPYAVELQNAGIAVGADQSSFEPSPTPQDFEKTKATERKQLGNKPPISPKPSISPKPPISPKPQISPKPEQPEQPELVKKAYQTARYVAALLGTSHAIEPPESYYKEEKVVTKKKPSEDPNELPSYTGERSTFEQRIGAAQLSNTTDGKVTVYETKDDLSKEQAQQFIKYILNQSGKTHEHQHKGGEIDECMSEVCQTCELTPTSETEIIKNEEVTTQEFSLVFAWPKKLNKGQQVVPVKNESKPNQPFRTIHLRRVMKVSDVDVEVLEGPTIETIEYRADGSTTRCITKGSPPTTEQTSSLQDKCDDAKSLTESDSPVVDQGSMSESDAIARLDSLLLSQVDEDRVASARKETSKDYQEQIQRSHAYAFGSSVGYGGTDWSNGTNEEDDFSRTTQSKESGSASPTLIEQTDRNVYLVNAGKYFSPTSREGPDAHVVVTKEAVLSREGSTECKTCMDNLAQNELDQAKASKGNVPFRTAHPVPCQRCLNLEAEIKLKLREFSAMVEQYCNRTTTEHTDGTNEDVKGGEWCFASYRGVRISASPKDDKPTNTSSPDGISEEYMVNEDSSTSFQRKNDLSDIDRFADNLSKYIIFRAKLYIVLVNPPKTEPDQQQADDLRGNTPETDADINGC